MKDVLTLILAGGKGTRLEPLTRDRAKPAVPFGGLYRIIDFTLSNCINSNLRRVLVLTQYKARSLDRHIAAGWGYLSRQLDEMMAQSGCVRLPRQSDSKLRDGRLEPVLEQVGASEPLGTYCRPWYAVDVAPQR